MQSTRWLSILGGVLVANSAIVCATSYWRLAAAQEDPAKEVTTQTPHQPQEFSHADLSAEDDESDLSLNPPEITLPRSAVDENGQLPNLSNYSQLPALEVPDVPSLDTAKMERDPVFQEFEQMFGAKQDDSILGGRDLPTSLYPETPSIGSSLAEHSGVYFAEVADRLKTISQLIASARGLTEEASSAANRKNHRQAAKLMQMSKQLRSMAAQLLEDSDL